MGTSMPSMVSRRTVSGGVILVDLALDPYLPQCVLGFVNPQGHGCFMTGVHRRDEDRQFLGGNGPRNSHGLDFPVPTPGRSLLHH